MQSNRRGLTKQEVSDKIMALYLTVRFIELYTSTVKTEKLILDKLLFYYQHINQKMNLIKYNS